MKRKEVLAPLADAELPTFDAYGLLVAEVARDAAQDR